MPARRDCSLRLSSTAEAMSVGNPARLFFVAKVDLHAEMGAAHLLSASGRQDVAVMGRCPRSARMRTRVGIGALEALRLRWQTRRSSSPARAIASSMPSPMAATSRGWLVQRLDHRNAGGRHRARSKRIATLRPSPVRSCRIPGRARQGSRGNRTTAPAAKNSAARPAHHQHAAGSGRFAECTRGDRQLSWQRTAEQQRTAKIVASLYDDAGRAALRSECSSCPWFRGLLAARSETSGSSSGSTRDDQHCDRHDGARGCVVRRERSKSAWARPEHHCVRPQSPHRGAMIAVSADYLRPPEWQEGKRDFSGGGLRLFRGY